jgi:hypothetical protein
MVVVHDPTSIVPEAVDEVLPSPRNVLNIETHNLANTLAYLQEGRHVWHFNFPKITCIPMNISNE